MSVEEKTSTTGVHFFYVVVILSLTIVTLITVKWTRLNGFTEYLSVAATVTSLVLAVLAIIYGFVSSGDIGRSLGSVELHAARIGAVAAELRAVLENSQKAQARAEERTGQLHELVDSMRSGLDSLAETTKEIAGSVEAMPDRISAMKSVQTQEAAEGSESEAVAGQDKELWSAERVERFLRRSSALGSMALYASLRAAQEDRYVDFMRLVGPGSYDYVYGFLIASHASGMLDLEILNTPKAPKGLRLKNPSDTLASVVIAHWEGRRRSTKRARRRVVDKFDAQIEGALADAGFFVASSEG